MPELSPPQQMVYSWRPEIVLAESRKNECNICDSLTPFLMVAIKCNFLLF